MVAVGVVSAAPPQRSTAAAATGNTHPPRLYHAGPPTHLHQGGRAYLLFILSLLLLSFFFLHPSSTSLLSILQVFGLLNRFWLFRWVAMMLALVTTVIVSPVAGVCEVVFRVGFSALASLSVLHPAPRARRCLSQPG